MLSHLKIRLNKVSQSVSQYVPLSLGRPFIVAVFRLLFSFQFNFLFYLLSISLNAMLFMEDE